MNNFKIFIQMSKKLANILNKQQRIDCIKVFICILFSGFFEILGIGVIFPFLTAMLTPEELMKNSVIKYVVNLLHISEPFQLICLIAVFVVIIYILKNLYLLYANYRKIDFQTKVQKELSVQMLSSYMKRNYTFFINTNSSEILRGINDDAFGTYAIIQCMFTLIANSFTIMCIMIYLLYVDLSMAVSIMFVSLVCVLTIVLVFKKKQSEAGNEVRKVAEKRNKSALQTIEGIKEILVKHKQDKFVVEYEEVYSQYRLIQRYSNFINMCPSYIIESFFIACLVLCVCIRIISGIDVSSSIAQLSVFAVAGVRLLPLLASTSSTLNQLVYYRPTLDEVYKNINIARQYQSKDVIHPEKNGITFGKELEVENVTFAYSNNDKEVLKDLSIRIKKGEMIGLIGESGSGKTTLADCILGLLKPQKGAIKVDGINISDYPYYWAKKIAYVPQKVYMLDDTIRNNVLFGEKEYVDDEKIWNALKKAQISDFVLKLPEQLDTIVGERGVKFSGGQIQRIAIARALYNDPDIIVFDEATAALDNETERAVVESIDGLHGEKTLIIIAHRLTTIRNSDKIYEIRDGKAIMCKKEDVFN